MNGVSALQRMPRFFLAGLLVLALSINGDALASTAKYTDASLVQGRLGRLRNAKFRRSVTQPRGHHVRTVNIVLFAARSHADGRLGFSRASVPPVVT